MEYLNRFCLLLKALVIWQLHSSLDCERTTAPHPVRLVIILELEVEITSRPTFGLSPRREEQKITIQGTDAKMLAKQWGMSGNS
mmetsp:Transcript_3014/g.4320  ORF Transcript_3014/g.4320 Transcript_3014/m.4320 type:complete len:84 (+) Transcript_3014:182-433(+)